MDVMKAGVSGPSAVRTHVTQRYRRGVMQVPFPPLAVCPSLPWAFLLPGEF